MNSLKRYRQLSSHRRKVLRQAILLVALARLLLQFSSLHMARKILPLAARCLRKQKASPRLEDEVWAVRVAGHAVRRSTCLVQALALHTLIERYGESAQLHIGVATGTQDEFLAHAWVQREDQVLIGGDESGRYTTLLSLH